MSEQTKPTEEEIKKAQLAKLAVEKFYNVEPDATNVIYKIAKFAAAKPKEYAYFKSLLDTEIKKIIKK